MSGNRLTGMEVWSGMETFLAVAFSFPTVVFSVLLAVAIIYWLISLLGMGDGDVGDGDVDGGSDFSGLMVTLGLQGVPLPLVLTLLFQVAWLVSYFSDLLLGSWFAEGILSLVFGVIMLPVSLVVGLLGAAVLVRPLRPLFRRAYVPPLQKRVIGTPCVITSSSVTESSGRAEAFLDGAHLVLEVRSDKPLSYRDRAVLIEHLPDNNAWWVIPEAEFLSGDHAG